MRIPFFAFLCVTLTAAVVSAKHYGYNRTVPFTLGAGLDPLDVSEAYPSCLSYVSEVRLDGQAARYSNVLVKAIWSREQLFKEIGASLELQAHTFFADVKAGASYLDELDFFEDALTFIILGSVDFGRVTMRDPQLTARAQKMINEKAYTDFAAACGTQYFAQEERGASVFAIYTIHNVSRSEKMRFDSMLKASAQLAFLVSANIDAQFKSLLAEASRSSRVEMRVLATGGGGLVSLSALATDTSDIAKVQSAIAAYMQTMTLQNAVPMGYTAASMKQFGYQEATPLNATMRDRTLAQYYLFVSDGLSLSKRLADIVGRKGSEYPHLSEAQVGEYRSTYEILSTDLASAQVEADNCYRDPSLCRPHTMTLPYVRWPTELSSTVTDMPSRITDRVRPAAAVETLDMSSSAECEAERVYWLNQGCLNEREYYDLKSLEAAPACDRRRSLVGWRFCRTDAH